jgi:UDP-3-O-[3-hydroxymyristoyl] N-acetylglucosamine deacetylase
MPGRAACGRPPGGFSGEPLFMQPRPQQTIRRAVSVAGKGYWTGRPCRVEFLPAPANTGLAFEREVGGVPVRIPVAVESRVEATARTNLAVAGTAVQMVEHVVSALAGLEIDCCLVRVTAEELPGLDGSARGFVQALDEAGIERLGSPFEPLVVRSPCRVGDDDAWIEALPPVHPGLSVEYSLDYGPGPIGRQTLCFRLSPAAYRAELAAARTFLLQSQAEELQAAGLAREVTTADLVVFGADGPIDNPLRWPDECVRHKVLDLIGDLALVGRPLHAHVRAHRSGHRLNALLAGRLRAVAGGRASA